MNLDLDPIDRAVWAQLSTLSDQTKLTKPI